jgi:chromosome segregation ATPase
MANKDKLLEMIDGKLGKEEVGTIESLTNDIVMITKKYDEALKRIDELESKSSGTTGMEKVFGLLKESASVVSDLKSKFLSTKGELSKATSKLETLQVENNGLAIANKRLDESLTAITKERDEYKSKFESVSSESKTESSNSAKLNESLDNSKKLNEELRKDNSTLTESLNSLRNKYVKVVAEAYGVSYEQLKLQSGSNPAPDKVESLAKSMRENDDRKRYMVPDLSKLGTKVKNESLDHIESGYDPELDRAGRIASLTK